MQMGKDLSGTQRDGSLNNTGDGSLGVTQSLDPIENHGMEKVKSALGTLKLANLL